MRAVLALLPECELKVARAAELSKRRDDERGARVIPGYECVAGVACVCVCVCVCV